MEIDFLDLLRQLVQQLQEIDITQSGITGTLLIIAIFIIAIGFIFQVLQKILEILVSIVENLVKLGFTYITDREKKLAIRRRQQFCLVLRSDLDSIAKAENWNDQWFTDLEAEVEAEGGYYSNALSRLLKRRSYGIRRVPSLVQAIQTSTERCMLLVGDPGSGKSIALRHLARTLADQGNRSQAGQLPVPLYINLKELPFCDLEALNADYIQQFVLEHVRRGDADTAAYVREHWQEYKNQGTWIFLFDSFDEIPAVLHAPNGSQATAAHSQALRQFMDGMGACRGILASREYKGPEALTWQKLRILPLKQQKQEELIENTFLKEDQKNLVRQHLATTETGIFGNPLFMSLLCRYIGDNQKVPNNDHDLLINHIERLARRDPDYIQKKYQLNAEQLLEGATLLAVLFAERPELSLAPKYDDIAIAFSERQYVFPVEIAHLLSALIEVKIGRSDVKEAKPGDRRFTFSHRRYQETLFVQYLAKYPEHIATKELLLDNRWREFTVTLIQSQPADIVKRFAQKATQIINGLEPKKIDVPRELAEGLYYFDWHNVVLLHLLTLLNEGFSRRLGEVPDSLRTAISRQLLPRWHHGDLYDKLMVVRYGGLLPVAKYQEVFEWAINTSVDQFLSASFNNAQYLGTLSDSMSQWLRNRFADETLFADNKIVLYKLDALGSRLPSSVGAPIIFSRCRSLRAWLYEPWPFRILVDGLVKGMETLWRSYNKEVKYLKGNRFFIIHLYIAIFIIFSTALISPWLPVACGLIIFPVFIRIVMCSEPTRITSLRLIHYFYEKFIAFLRGIVVVIAFSIILGNFLSSLQSSHSAMMIAFLIIIYASFLLILSLPRINSFRAKRHLRKMLAIYSNDSVWQQIRQANTADELEIWLRNGAKSWLDDSHVTRSILRYIENDLNSKKAETHKVKTRFKYMKPIIDFLRKLFDVPKYTIKNQSLNEYLLGKVDEKSKTLD